MSEQEKSDGGTDPSVVLVEQPIAQKQAFHPIELHEDIQPEKYYKRSNAPATPSTIELKESRDTKSKDKIESELVMSSEKLKRNVIKKVPSINRRGSSPETIKLGSITADVKASATTKPQPIPAPMSITEVGSDLDILKKDYEKEEDEDKEKKEDEDSITGEIAELRTPAMHKISSEWANNSGANKKREVTWNDNDYLKKVKIEDLGAKSQLNVLERKSSLGPCFRAAAPFGRPSGLSLCLSQKPVYVTENDEYNPKKSIINITLSKKCLLNKTIYRAESAFEYPDPFDDQNKKTKDVPKENFLGVLRKKISNMSGKIKNVFV